MSTEHPSVAEPQRGRRRGQAQGAAGRPRRSGSPAPDRADPVSVLTAQDASREPDLVPIRHGRMSASPFAFFRGGAAIMAADLATVPNSGLVAQLCGDAHAVNFGLYASPERRLLFDVNDFDETLARPVRVGREATGGQHRDHRRRAAISPPPTSRTPPCQRAPHTGRRCASSPRGRPWTSGTPRSRSRTCARRTRCRQPGAGRRRDGAAAEASQASGRPDSDRQAGREVGRRRGAVGAQQHPPRPDAGPTWPHSPNSPRSRAGGGGSSRPHRWCFRCSALANAIPRRRTRSGRRSAAGWRPTPPACRPTASGCCPATRWWTSRGRWSASAASACSTSSCCCRAATSNDALFLQVKQAGRSVLADHLPLPMIGPSRGAGGSRAAADADRLRPVPGVVRSWRPAASRSTGASCAT